MSRNSPRQNIVRVVRNHIHRMVQIRTLTWLVFLALECFAQVHILLLIGLVYVVTTLLEYWIFRAFFHHTLNVEVSGVDRELAE